MKGGGGAKGLHKKWNKRHDIPRAYLLLHFSCQCNLYDKCIFVPVFLTEPRTSWYKIEESRTRFSICCSTTGGMASQGYNLMEASEIVMFDYLAYRPAARSLMIKGWYSPHWWRWSWNYHWPDWIHSNSGWAPCARWIDDFLGGLVG